MAWRGRGPLWLGLLALLVAASSGVAFFPKFLPFTQSSPLLNEIILFAETAAQKDIPAPKMSQMMGPTIKFLYCSS